MNTKLLLRIASGLTLFFATGHSVGHFTRKSHMEPEAQAVFKAMEGYKFPIGSQFRTYDEFFDGMSLNLTISLVAFMILLWMLSNIANEFPKVCNTLIWPVLIGMIGFTITGFVYFFFVPAITCLLISMLLLASMFMLKKKV
jgi:hypothetical protein